MADFESIFDADSKLPAINTAVTAESPDLDPSFNIEIDDGDLVFNIAYCRWGNEEYYCRDFLDDAENEEDQLENEEQLPTAVRLFEDRIKQHGSTEAPKVPEENKIAERNEIDVSQGDASEVAIGTAKKTAERNASEAAKIAEGDANEAAKIAEGDASEAATGTAKKTAEGDADIFFSDDEGTTTAGKKSIAGTPRVRTPCVQKRGGSDYKTVRSTVKRSDIKKRLKRHDSNTSSARKRLCRKDSSDSITCMEKIMEAGNEVDCTSSSSSSSSSSTANNNGTGGKSRLSEASLRQLDGEEEESTSFDVDSLKIKHALKMSWLYMKTEPGVVGSATTSQYRKLGSLQKLQISHFDEENLSVDLVFHQPKRSLKVNVSNTSNCSLGSQVSENGTKAPAREVAVTLMFAATVDYQVFVASVQSKGNPLCDRSSKHYVEPTEYDQKFLQRDSSKDADEEMLKRRRKGLGRVLVRAHSRKGHRVAAHYRKIEVTEEYQNKQKSSWADLFD